MKKMILKIMFWAAFALIIPLVGNQFVEGWNWNWNDFIFAWVFFAVMGTTIYLVTKQVLRTGYRIAIGAAVFLLFAFVWVVLATG